MNNQRIRPTAGSFLLPCAQPMEPSVKRHYIAGLIVLIIALVYVNVSRFSPAPLSCRTESHQ